jgi:hypothetical protein
MVGRDNEFAELVTVDYPLRRALRNWSFNLTDFDGACVEEATAA